MESIKINDKALLHWSILIQLDSDNQLATNVQPHQQSQTSIVMKDFYGHSRHDSVPVHTSYVLLNTRD